MVGTYHKQVTVFNGHGSLSIEGLEHLLVIVDENAAGLIDDLSSTNDFSLVVHDRHAENALLGAEASFLVECLVEPVILVRIGNVDCLAQVATCPAIPRPRGKRMYSVFLLSSGNAAPIPQDIFSLDTAPCDWSSTRRRAIRN